MARSTIDNVAKRTSSASQRRQILAFALATPADVAELVALHNAVSEHLTSAFGKGHWSGTHTQRGVLLGMKHARVLIARHRRRIVGTLRLVTKKPWAIDTAYFTAVPRAVYLLGMAVKPSMQRCGIGRRMLDEVAKLAREWPSQAIRLDAYDSEAGAGEFYAKCGYREVGRINYRGTPLVYFEMLV